MDILKEVLEHYSIYPLEIEKVTNRLFRVHDGMRDYALKRSYLNENNIESWVSIYHVASERNISEILPVYVTKDGSLYQKHEHFYYYLSPWVDIPRNMDINYQIESTMQTLALIHKKTKQTERIKIDKMKKDFEGFQSFNRNIPDGLKENIVHFESRRYMSPFELIACSQYKAVVHASELLQNKMNAIFEQEEDSISWSKSLCHGKLEPSHCRGGYLLNWEEASFDHPSTDIANYFQHITGHYDQPIEEMKQAFKLYRKTNHLTVKEIHLLTINLLNPAHYIRVVQNFTEQRTKKSMLEQTRELQHQFRRLQFGMNWVDFIQEEYETINVDTN